MGIQADARRQGGLVRDAAQRRRILTRPLRAFGLRREAEAYERRQ
jgi:hypothetical protein